MGARNVTDTEGLTGTESNAAASKAQLAGEAHSVSVGRVLNSG